jgi:cobalt-zinc-cadmium efflux system outer membrane protein
MNMSLFAALFLAASVGRTGAQPASLPGTDPAAPDSAISQTNSLSLDAVVSEILVKNPELNFYIAELQAARAGYKTAARLDNPQLSSELGRKSVRGSGEVSDGLAWSVSVQQTFEWPGRIPLRKAIANQQIKLAQLGIDQFKATLAAKARNAAYKLFAADAQAAAAREVADRLQALRAVLVQRDPAGLTPELELRIIEATNLGMQRKATQAELAMQSALLELNQLRGERWLAPARIAPPDAAFKEPPELELLLRAAMTNNFEMQMRRAELEQQGFKVLLAKNERYPSVSAGPFISQERAGETENIIGIGVSIPLPLWNRNEGSIQTARARELQAQASLAVTQREIERKVTEAWIACTAKIRDIRKWRPDAIEQFQNAAALADRHYRLGAVPANTYIELQQQYLEAVEGLLETRAEALAASLALEALTGIPMEAPRKQSSNPPSKP